MNSLKFLPLLIAAAFVMPRAHAATQEAPQRSQSAALWIGVGLLLLGGSQRRTEPFKAIDAQAAA